MERSNYSPQNEVNRPNLAENIWMILSLLLGVIVVANINEDASRVEIVLTITIAVLTSAGVTLLIRVFSKFFDSPNY